MTDMPERDTGRQPQEVAAYVAELTADLARIARCHQLNVLGYLLDMARLEAQHAAGRITAHEPRDQLASDTNPLP